MTIPAPWGSEILVNVPAGTQSQPKLFAYQDGGFVSLYAVVSPDGATTSLRGQLFDADGEKAGGEFIIATGGGDFAPAYPTGIALTDGRFVVTWQEYVNHDEAGIGREIRAQIFNPDTSRSGNPVVVNDVTPMGEQLHPAITALSNGGFAIVYEDPNPSDPFAPPRDDIMARVFDASGQAVDTRFVANDTTARTQASPSVAGLADNRFVVVYTDSSRSPDDPAVRTIRGRILTHDGQEAVSEFLVASETGNTLEQPTVVSLSDGRFVVAWTELKAQNSGTVSSIKAQVFSESGAKIGSTLTVDTSVGDEILDSPSLAPLSGGGFAVVYCDAAWPETDVHLVTFDVDGNRASDERIANPSTEGSQSSPTIAALADGRFVVAWQDESVASVDFADIHAQIFDAGSGEPEVVTGTDQDEPLDGTNGDDRIYALAGNDTLNGLAGNDWLDGGSGTDTMRGGRGNDSYVVDDVGDRIVEAANEGHDTVVTTFSFSLADLPNVEALNVGGSADADLTGNDAANQLLGSRGANRIDGGRGADMMAGFTGNDTYVVDNAGDRVSEVENGGLDTVETGVSFALGDHVEALTGTGTAAISLTGNGLANIITGNAAANAINGGQGNDTLSGAGGDDIVTGGAGADRIDGGSGFDTVSFAQATSGVTASLSGGSAGEAAGDVYAGIEGLSGSAFADRFYGSGKAWLSGQRGNDTYMVSASDQVFEKTGGGSDTVIAATSFALRADAEVEVLRTSAATATKTLNLTGSDYGNTILGNAGRNQIKGLGGADIIQSGSGNDRLFGGLGNDQLRGGSGRDVFVFDTRLNKSTNVDRVLDFRSQDDSFYLDNSIFTKLGSGSLSRPKKFSSDMFVEGTRALDREDRIIYDKKTGALSYDKDGTGSSAQVKIATIVNKTALKFDDFFVI